MDTIIETDHVSKHYKNVKAVDQLSLRVKQGEIYAFLGLNGAGKTTTIRMLLGMIKPTNGSVEIMGKRIMPGENVLWKDVGYLVETPHAYPELTVMENLAVSQRLHPGTPTKYIKEIIERLGLAEYQDRRSGNLSLGNIQRLGLAKALLHHPSLLFLDEPANGLDPAGIIEIRELLLGLTREQGVTIFMSSHILAEVSRLAQRIGIIHKGHLIQELDIGELENNRIRRLLLRTTDNDLAYQILTRTGESPNILPDGSIELTSINSIDKPERINHLLDNSGATPTQLLVEEEDLENYFIRLIGMNKGLVNE